MLDDFRLQAEDSRLDEPEEEFEPFSPAIIRKRHFLGLSPAQRCVLLLMLFGLTVMLSSLCLLVTEKVAPPFL